jgi:predicted enzyme related to lactoylglutathione lyase
LHNKRAGEKYRENGVLIFNYEGVKGLYEKMGREGIKVAGLHEVHPGHWSFHVNDPSGNELSVFGPA